MSACMCWRHIRFFSAGVCGGFIECCCCWSWAVPPSLASPLPGACPQSLRLPLSSLRLRLRLRVRLHPSGSPSQLLPPPVSCPSQHNSGLLKKEKEKRFRFFLFNIITLLMPLLFKPSVLTPGEVNSIRIKLDHVAVCLFLIVTMGLSDHLQEDEATLINNRRKRKWKRGRFFLSCGTKYYILNFSAGLPAGFFYLQRYNVRTRTFIWRHSE